MVKGVRICTRNHGMRTIPKKEMIQNKIETYSPMVYRLAYALVKSRVDADDIHQEVFLRYLKYQPSFENAEHEKAWFIRVTTNQCKNWWKTAWRRNIVSWSKYEEEAWGQIRRIRTLM